ncbi:hypothetical protein D1Y84_04375 [Acidipila sp. EB88]|nr:hypothetical protein D1Y84_04375 [Acidipila sp. EB88]
MTRFQTVFLGCALAFLFPLALRRAEAQATIAPLVSSTVLDGDSPRLLKRPGESQPFIRSG